MHQRARTDPSGGRGATRVPTGTQGNAELVTRLCDVDDSKIVGFPKATAAVSVAVLKCSVFFLAFVPIHTDAEMCVVNWGRGDSNAPIQRW